MPDYNLTRIKFAIREKKKSIELNKWGIDLFMDYISSSKDSFIDKNGNEKIKPQMKNAMAKIKYLKKAMSVSRKELKIYEAEYKKKQKDPNYNINFDSLKKLHNKNNTYI